MTGLRLALCTAQGLALCESCARNVARYTPEQQAANPGRITPSTDGHRCAAWCYAQPRGAVTPTDSRSLLAGTDQQPQRRQR